MKLSDVSNEDGKMCGQLLNFLKIVDMPKEMKMADSMAMSEVMAWLNGLVKQIVGQLSVKKESAPTPPAPTSLKPIPLPKKKSKK